MAWFNLQITNKTGWYLPLQRVLYHSANIENCIVLFARTSLIKLAYDDLVRSMQMGKLGNLVTCFWHNFEQYLQDTFNSLPICTNNRNVGCYLKNTMIWLIAITTLKTAYLRDGFLVSNRWIKMHLILSSWSLLTPLEQTIGFGSVIPTTTALIRTLINGSVQGGDLHKIV